MNKIIKIVFVVLLYFIFGKLGLMLAIPPGYATIIWPAAGIALAVVLIYGYEVCIGVFLGSFLVNVFTSLDTSSYTSIILSCKIPFIIAMGAAAQAVFGAWLLKKILGQRIYLIKVRDIALFLFLGGPVCCLINASIGVFTLARSGLIESSSFFFSWLTWWTGDSIGVFIFAPLFLIFFAKPRGIWNKRRFTVGLPLIMTFISVVILFQLSNDAEKSKVDLIFQRHVDSIEKELEEQVHSYFTILYFIKSFYDSSQHVDRNEFSLFVNHAIEEFPAVTALEWIPRVKNDQRSEFEASAKKDGFEKFVFNDKNSQDQFVPLPIKEEYYPVYYVEPIEGNESALGFDLSSNSSRREAIERARDQNLMVATEGVALVQENEQAKGVLVFLPVYSEGALDTVAQRQERIHGLVLGVFKIKDLVHHAVTNAGYNGINVKLFDQTNKSRLQSLYEFNSSTSSVNSEKETIDLKSVKKIDFAKRDWRVEFTPTQEYYFRQFGKNTWIIMIGSLFFNSFISAFLLFMGGRNIEIEDLILLRTKELRESEQRFDIAVRGSKDGIWDWDMETDVVFYSQRFKRLLGYDDEEFKNVLESFRSHLHPDDIEKTWEHIKLHVEEKKPYDVEYRLKTKSGDYRWFRAKGQAHWNEEGKPLRMAGSISDITNMKKNAQLLKQQKEELEKVNLELDRFVYTASHDLRAPLRAIASFSQFLDEDYGEKLDDQGKDYLKEIGLGAKRMDNLINDLLSLSRISRIKNPYEDVAIDKLLNEVLERLKYDITEFDVDVQIESTLPVIHCDRIKLTEVFANLIGNGIKFSSKNSDHPQIKIGYEELQLFHQFYVQDNGIGIDKEFHKQIFGIFRRLHKHGDYEGTGAGLSIVKRIIEDHGGEVWVESEFGKGAKFYFKLPKIPKDKIVKKEKNDVTDYM